ncbi:MAG: ATP-binding protein [Oscillospiraceae bacterium]|nr:ATP-binding protein [Oscillospiraceae bacterium]
MSYNGRLLADARAELERIRQENEKEHSLREQLAYSKVEQLGLLDARLRSQMTELVRVTVARRPDMMQRIREIEEENLELQARRAEMLTEAGFPMDYLDDIYSCEKCHDSGVFEGKPCSCLQKIYNRLLTAELSPIMLDGNEDFANFDLSFYPAEYDFTLSASPRDVMRLVLDRCRSFAEDFPKDVPNLLLRGGTGLGKTYLSACIAKVVAEKGYSVCYDSAAFAFEAFEKQKFSRDPEESERSAAKVSRMLDCDLMILDDLGTEMVTSLTVSALYTLINTRLISRRPIIISTNCSNEELAKKYSPQICSRILGEFKILPFCGSDIRLLKKSR